MTTTINDEETLHSIVNDLGANLMVEAGAGTGKTYALVSRVVALVKAGVRMQNIVAITFTDAAAAELSERVRSRMEQLLDDGLEDSDEDLLARDLTEQEKGRIRQAVAELDQAAVQTIHSFAAQLLRERPLSASLPPGWMPLDAVASTQRFAERWDQWLEGTLGQDPEANPELRESLRYLIGVKAGIGTWRQVAKDFADNYERLASEGSLAEIDLRALAMATLGELEGLRAQCVNDSDSLFEQISAAIETVAAVLEVADRPLDALRALADKGMYRYCGLGREMTFWHLFGTKPKVKRVLLLPEPRPGPSAEPKMICHPKAGNTPYIPLSAGLWTKEQKLTIPAPKGPPPETGPLPSQRFANNFARKSAGLSR